MKRECTRRRFGALAAGLTGAIADISTGASETATGATTSVPQYYVSPDGDDANDGSKTSPLASPRPLTEDGRISAEDGATIYFRGGGEIAYEQGNWFYDQDDLTLLPYGGESPVLRATNPDKSDTFGPGLLQFGQCTGTVVRGLEVYDSPAGGIKFENADDCTVEQCNTHHCDFSGISIIGGSNFIARYNESWGNFGPEAGEPGSVPGGDSDGIGVSRDSNRPVDGVLIEYNRLHHNSDDGFDGIGGKNGVVRNNWVWANGYDANGNPVSTTSGTGIKLGYYDMECGPWDAYGNKAWYNGNVAFMYNWDGQPAYVYNNTCYANVRKPESNGWSEPRQAYEMPQTGSSTEVISNVSGPRRTGAARTASNSWQELSKHFDADWFESVAMDEKGNPTDPTRFLRPTEDSPLRDRVRPYRESDSATIGATMTMPNLNAEDPGIAPGE